MDYTGSVIIQELGFSGQGHDLLSPIVYMRDPEDHRIRLDSPGSVRGDPGRQRNWTANFRPQEEKFGFVTQVSGAPQHVLIFSLGQLGPNASLSALSQANSDQTRGSKNISAVIYTKLDDRLAKSQPDLYDDEDLATLELLDTASGDVLSVLELDFDHYGLDYIVPDTTLDAIDDEAAVAEGGYVRDERTELERIARAAQAWYATPRSAVRIELLGITHRLKLGQMITKLDGDDVNSLVTSVVWDFHSQTTTVQTNFYRLDEEVLDA